MTTPLAIQRLPQDRQDAIIKAALDGTDGEDHTSRAIVDNCAQDARDWLADHFRMDPTPRSLRDALSLYDALMSTPNTTTASAGWATEYTFTQRIYTRPDGTWVLDRADRNKETP